VGWGASEVLRILAKYEKGTQEQMEKAYREAGNVAIFTSLTTNLVVVIDYRNTSYITLALEY
jgi:hypothetical protein